MIINSDSTNTAMMMKPKRKTKQSVNVPPPRRRQRGCKCCKLPIEQKSMKRKHMQQQQQRLWETNGEAGLGWWSDAEQAAVAAAYQLEQEARKERKGERTQPQQSPAYDPDAFLFGGIGDLMLPRAQPITQIQDKHLAKQIASFAKARTKEAAKNHAFDNADRSSPKEAYQQAVSKMGLFDYEELQLGELLGVGGFSHVYEITGFNIGGEDEDEGHEPNSNNTSNSSIDASSSSVVSHASTPAPLAFSESLVGTKLAPSSKKERAASLSYSPKRRSSALLDRRKSTGGSMIAAASSTPTRRKSKIGPATYSDQQQIAREFLAQHALRPVDDTSERGGDADIHRALDSGVNQHRVVITRGSSKYGSFYNPGDRSRDENSALFRETRESLSTQLMADNSTAFFSKEFQEELHHAAQGSGKTTPRYAVKHLKPSLLQEQPLPNRFAKAAMDLACEAEMLVALNHPNIVKLRGWATGGPDKLKEGKHTSYFLIMDCLTETLQDRIGKWREQHQELYGWRRRLQYAWSQSKTAASKCLRLKKTRRRRSGSKKSDSPKDRRSGSFSKSNSSKSLRFSGASSIASKTAEELLLIERIKVAYDIACALEYLHEKRVIYRDLKSTNIGFNVRGDVQIFDFGLARYLPKSEIDASESLTFDDVPDLSANLEKAEVNAEKNTPENPLGLNETFQLENPLGHEEECFQMSHVGTRRYTAPEVDLKRPYNLKADVYSFGVVLWEIMSMSSAVSKGRKVDLAMDHASQQSRQTNYRNGKPSKKQKRRSKLMKPCNCWPEPVQQLVASMMADDLKSRPTMKHVRETLERVYVSLTTENPDDPDSQEMHLLKRQRRRSTFCMDAWAREAKNVMEDFLEDVDEDDDDNLPALEDPLTKSVRSHTSHLTNEVSTASELTSSANETQ